MRTTTLLLFGLALLFTVPACGEPSDELKDVSDKFGDTWDAVKTYGVKKRADAEAWFAKQAEAFPEKLAAAKKKAAAAGGEASEALDASWAVAQE